MSTLIHCDNLSKRFGSKTALANVSFSLQQGDVAALIGPNGAGKTTLFSILCGYLRADSGSVSLLGHKPGSSALCGRLAALPQDAQFDPAFSIGEQLDFYGRLQGLSHKAAKLETDRVLALVELSAQRKHKAAALSHGMRKRAAIAQAFIGSPRLVLLDEPTAGLDPAHALQIRQLISQLSSQLGSQVSFMISSHNIFELEQLCNKVLYLQQGQLSSPADNKDSDGAEQYLTLLLEQQADQPLLALLQQLPGLISVRPGEKNQLLLSYNSDQQPQFDLELLQRLAAHGYRYRNLIKGQTLEQKLFSAS